MPEAVAMSSRSVPVPRPVPMVTDHCLGPPETAVTAAPVMAVVTSLKFAVVTPRTDSLKVTV